MKKVAKLLCLLLIGALLLAGCDTGIVGDALDAAGDTVKEKAFTNAGVTLTLTTKFLDFTSTATNSEEYDFLYSSEDHAVFGMKELKADLTAQFGELTAQSYGDLIASLYTLDVKTQEKDSKYTYNYEVDGEDGEKITFTCLFLEAEDAFWFIQASCPSAQYAEDKDQIWSWLSSATIAAA